MTDETCVLCGWPIDGYGANPAPLADGRCCEWCDQHIVIPLRIRIATREREEPLTP
jgi:hypothetical protein